MRIEYSNSSNCNRAAKKALGKDAKNGVDFTIEKVETGTGTKFVFNTIPKLATEPANGHKPKKARKAKGALWQQPRYHDLLRMMARVDGVTAIDFAEKHKMKVPSARSMASRLSDEIPAIEASRVGRNAVYKIAKDKLPEGFTHE